MGDFPVPMQAGPFQPVRSYDVPRIVLSQLLDNEATFEGFRSAFLAPDRLSPQERSTLADRLVEQFGGGAFARAAVGVATNPWVWLMFLTSGYLPEATAVLKQGKSLFGTRYGVMVRKSMAPLHSLGLTTSPHLMEGSITPTVGLAIGDAIRNLSRAEAATIQPAAAALLARLQREFPRIKSLDWKQHSGREREVLLEISDARMMRMSGVDRGYMRPVAEVKRKYYKSELAWDPVLKARVRVGIPERLFDPRAPGSQGQAARVAAVEEGRLREMRAQYYKDAEEKKEMAHRAGAPEPKIPPWSDPYEVYYVPEETSRKKMVLEPGIQEWREQVDSVYKRWGLEEYDQAVNKAARQRLVDMIGDEQLWRERNIFKVDEQKAFNIARHAKGPVLSGAAEGMHEKWQGVQALAKAVDAGTLLSVAKGEVTPEKYARILQDLFMPYFESGAYFPRNVLDVVPVRGVKVDHRQMAEIWDNPVSWVISSGRAAPLTERTLFMHPEDLERMRERWGTNDAVEGWIKQARRTARRRAVQGKTLLAYKADAEEAWRRFFKDTRETVALHSDPITSAEFQAEKEYLKTYSPERLKGRFFPPNARTGLKLPYSEEVSGAHPDMLPGFGKDPKRAVSRAMLLEREYAAMPDEAAKVEFVRTVVPAALGSASPWRAAQESATRWSKRWLDALAKGPAGKAIRTYGGERGARFVDEMERLADPRLGLEGLGVSGNLAKYLYVTHLGLNLASVVLNMMQPMILAGTALGPTRVLRAYGKAAGEMLDYAAKRYEKYGIGPITEAQRLELMESSLKYMGRATGGKNILRIGPSPAEAIDSAVYANLRGGRSSWAQRALFEFPMKMFEKSEWFSRNVVAHAMEEAYLDAGLTVAHPNFIPDAERMVMETQFGTEEFNTPRLFLKSPFLNNPLVRQFSTFLLRSFTGAFSVLPQLGGRDYFAGLAQTFVRGMGTSAIIYELGKGFLGADLSRGLFASATFDIFGGGRLTEKGRDWVPIPPIADIPVSFIQGLAASDIDLMRESVARSLPGGIAIFRALGVLPDLSRGVLSPVGAAQRTYAAWDQRDSQGRVPVFKGDGSLLDYRSPSELVLRGLGVDLSKFNTSAELDNYLIKNREEILRYRQKYMAQMAGGMTAQAQATGREFQKRFGVPLTVTRSQWRSFLKIRTVPRTERILDRISPQERGLFGEQVLGMGPGRLGLPPGTILTGTSGQRDQREMPLAPEVIERIKRQMQREADLPGSTKEQGFSPFQGY